MSLLGGSVAATGVLSQTRIGGAAHKDRELPLSVTDLWVDRDGTSYALGAQGMAMCREGEIKVFEDVSGYLIAGNRSALFVSAAGVVHILEKPRKLSTDRESLAPRSLEIPPGKRSSGSRDTGRIADADGISGLFATEKHLYLSRPGLNRIERWSLADLKPEKYLPFESPGKIVPDPWEGLWVARETSGGKSDGAPLVRISLRDGSVLENVTGPEIPIALAIAPVFEDGYPQLFVGDNGRNQRVLRYSRRHPRKTRELSSIGNRFGVLGTGKGILDRRINGLIGLGVALNGTLVVAQNWNLHSPRDFGYSPRGSEVAAFSGGGDLLYEYRTMNTGAPAALERESPHQVFYGRAQLGVDWEADPLTWSLLGRTDHPLLLTKPAYSASGGYGQELRLTLGKPMLFHVEGGLMLISRRDPAVYGQAWVPLGAFDAGAGKLRGGKDESFGYFWMDGRGAEPLDGIIQSDELESLRTRIASPTWSVDDAGGVWAFGMMPEVASDYDNGLRLAAWLPDRMDKNDVPVYKPFPVQRPPPDFESGGVIWYRSDSVRNSLAMAGVTPFLPGSNARVLCVYSQWYNPLRFAATYRKSAQVVLDSGAAMRPGAPDDRGARALDIVGDWLLALYERPASVVVYDLRVGNRVETIPMRDAGASGAQGASKPLVQGVRLENGNLAMIASQAAGELEGIVWRPPSGYREERPAAPVSVSGQALESGASFSWTTADSGLLDGFNVYRSVGESGVFETLTEAPLKNAFYTAEDLRPGQLYRFGVTALSPSGESAMSEIVRIVPNKPIARYIGEDRSTGGDWRRRYGRLGHFLFGERRGSPEVENPRLPDFVDGPPPWLGLGENGADVEPEYRFDPALPRRFGARQLGEGVVGMLRVEKAEPVAFRIATRTGGSVRLSVYCGSSEYIHGVCVEMLNPLGGEVLDKREFSNENEPHVRGRYMSWDLTGTVVVRLSYPRNVAPPDLCGINALFLDPSMGSAADSEQLP